MKVRMIFILVCLLFTTGRGMAQTYTYYEDMIEVVHDTVYVYDTVYIHMSNLEAITKKFGITYDQYVRDFMKYIDVSDTLQTDTRVESAERIYMNYFLPLVNSADKVSRSRLIAHEYIVSSDRSKVKLDIVNGLGIDSTFAANGVALDCMLTFYGADNTNIFLKSQSQIRSCMAQAFSQVDKAKGEIKGINLYFPDYSFREKKEMAQFLKSVSLVIDSINVNNIRGMRFYASFDKRNCGGESDFLCGLTQMVDSIFVFDFKGQPNTFPDISVVNKSHAESLNLLAKLRNQFYMARYFTDDFPTVTPNVFVEEDVYNLMDADYPDNNWEIYVLIICCIVLLVISLVVLYLVSPGVSYYLNKNMDYVYSIIVMLILEILLLVASMFESMSKEDVFTLGSGNSRFFILLLPLLLVFIIPMMKAIGRRKSLP